jgi:4-amino-4-deoxy-L-arabinose transferase-like glycosyltransferase
MAPAEGKVSLRDLLLLLVAALALFLPGFFTLPPVDRDEPRYAVATTQMLATHDFVDIRYQEKPRYLQPVGVYWLQSITASVFTAPEHRAIWAYRLPSLLGALLAVLMTAGTVGALFGRKAGLMAGGLLAACVSLSFETRIAKTDAALLAAVATAQFAMLRVYLGQSQSRGWPVLFWTALGAGVLIKGPIILLIVGLTILALVIWDRSGRWLLRLKPVLGLPLFLLITLPWYIAIGQVTHGAFFQAAVGDNLLHKVGNGQQSHGAPPGYHLASFLLMFWPGSLLALFAAPFAWAERRRPEVRFLICWIVPSWIVFELIATKLPHYVLPLFPAIAALTAVALLNPGRPVWTPLRWLFWLVLALWVVVSVVLSVLAPVGLFHFTQAVSVLSVVLSLCALFMVGALLWALAKRRTNFVVPAAMGAALFVTSNVYGVALPNLKTLWLSPRIVETARSLTTCRGRTLITTPYHEPSLVFLNGPSHTQLANNGAEAADRLSKGDACTAAVIGAKQEAAFQTRATALGLKLDPFARVGGQNYSDGKDPGLTLYTATPAK